MRIMEEFLLVVIKHKSFVPKWDFTSPFKSYKKTWICILGSAVETMLTYSVSASTSTQKQGWLWGVHVEKKIICNGLYYVINIISNNNVQYIKKFKIYKYDIIIDYK